jgi:hypothetical protein
LILLSSQIKKPLPKTRFTRFLVRLNQPQTSGFEEWVFREGMTFGAPDTWWAEKGPRARPHEGLDICFFSDMEGRVLRLLPGTKIPVMYDGTLVALLDDFLGKTLIVEHGIRDEDGRVLCSMYAHLTPDETMQPGRVLQQGDIIAGLAPAPSKAAILPHLHLSLGWASRAIEYDALDWRTLGEEEKLALVDPLPALGCVPGGSAQVELSPDGLPPQGS